MPGFPLPAARACPSPSAAHHPFFHVYKYFSCYCHSPPQHKTQPCSHSCGLWGGEEFCLTWNGCNFTLYRQWKWKTRSCVCLKTEIPNPNPKWRNRRWRGLGCLGSLQTKATRESLSNTYFRSLHFLFFPLILSIFSVLEIMLLGKNVVHNVMHIK